MTHNMVFETHLLPKILVRISIAGVNIFLGQPGEREASFGWVCLRIYTSMYVDIFDVLVTHIYVPFNFVVIFFMHISISQ